MISIESVVNAISARAHGRFIVSSDDDTPLFSSLDSENNGICRLKRIGAPSGCRTILIASLASRSESLQCALRWAADVREQLPEPETADLYMFLLIENVSFEDAGRIEADDQFCQKVVLRPEEKVNEFLDRTFLSALTFDGETGMIGDPLQTALHSMADKHPWTGAHLPAWRALLLSGKSGSELAQALDGAFDSDEGVL